MGWDRDVLGVVSDDVEPEDSVTRHKCKRESSVTSALSEIIMVCKASN